MSLFAGPGGSGWDLRFTSLYEHRETPELDRGLPTSLDKKPPPQQHNQNSGVVAQAVAQAVARMI